MFHTRGIALVILLAGLLFGAVAVVLARGHLEAPGQAAAAVDQQPDAPLTTTVVVAGRELRFGEQLTPDSLREIAWPQEAVPDGAFTTVSDIGSSGQRVVLSTIGANEPVLAWKISGPGARAGLSAMLKEGMRAVTVRVNEHTGVAGFILPGDRVDVLFTREQGTAEDAGAIIEILLQNVRVLAINQISDDRKAEPIVGNVVTLELSPGDAQKVALAQTTGSITLTLRAAGSLDPSPSQAVVEGELVSNTSVYHTAFKALTDAQSNLEERLQSLAGVIPAVETRLTAKIEDAADSSKSPAPAAAEKLPATVQMTIHRGLSSATQTVPQDPIRR